jgi:hypothetical protein
MSRLPVVRSEDLAGVEWHVPSVCPSHMQRWQKSTSGHSQNLGTPFPLKDEPSLLDIFIVRLIVIALSWDTLSISWDVHLFSGTHHRPVESGGRQKSCIQVT